MYFLAFFMILIGVALFTVTTPTQASRRESLITMKYWSDYASSLFCECTRSQYRSAEQEGYRAMNTTNVSDNTDNDDDCNERNENTKHIEI